MSEGQRLSSNMRKDGLGFRSRSGLAGLCVLFCALMFTADFTFSLSERHLWPQSVHVVWFIKASTTMTTSLVPANDLVEKRLDQTSLVGDGVLTDVDRAFLQRLFDHGWNLPPVDCRGRHKAQVTSLVG